MSEVTDWVRSVAKAVAALLVPFVLYGLGEAAEWIGMDATFIDRDIVEASIVAIVAAIVVWAVRNRQPPRAG